jgi:hypothetical protein
MPRSVIFRRFRHSCRPSDFLSGCDSSRTASNFSDSSEPSPLGDLPGSRGNPPVLTVKPATRQPRHLAAPAVKPTRHLPGKRIGAGYCCNRHHSWGNKHSRLAPRLQFPPREAPHTFLRSVHQRNPRIRSVLPGTRHPTRIRFCRFWGKAFCHSWNENSPTRSQAAMGCNPTRGFTNEIPFRLGGCTHSIAASNSSSETVAKLVAESLMA